MTDQTKIPAPEPCAWANHANLISAKIARERKGNAGASELHTWREGGPTDYHGVALCTLESAETYAAALAEKARQEERAKLIKVLTLANAALSMSDPCAAPDCKAEQQEWKDAAMQEIDAAIRAG
jgi:hypothetical protein